MKESGKRWLAFAPMLLLLAVAYVVPLTSNIINSFHDDAGNYVGFQNYADVLGSYYFLDSLWFTLKVAFVTTVLSMLIAIIVAMALRENFAGKKLALFLFQYNLCVPHMVVAMLMIMLLSQTGIVSSIAYQLGLIDGAQEFPWLVRDSKGIGIVITFVWKYFPYIGLSVLGILQGASREYEAQAATLGVGKLKRFFHVVLPSIMPATTAASIIVFSAAFGEYEIPALLGSASHRMLSIMVYVKYCNMSTRNVPQAYAMMTMMMLALAFIILLYYILTSRGGRLRKR